MSRFVLRYAGPGNKPLDDVHLVRGQSALRILDESARMLLVDSDDVTIGLLQRKLPNWRISAETLYTVPKPPTIKRPIE
jgi:hypothetical protein